MKLRNKIKELERILHKSEKLTTIPAIHKIKTKDTKRRLNLAIKELSKDKEELIHQAILENARKAAKTRKSPYEKAGTIVAVNELLEENQEILKRKGGNGRWQHQRKRNGVASRFYVLIGEAPPDFDE